MRSKRPSSPSAQSPCRNVGAIGEAESGGVALGISQRLSRRVDAQPARLAAIAQRGEQQGARPGAEIEHRGRPLAAEMRDRRLDQRLAVRPGHEHARTDRQPDRPEIAPADDVGDWLVREPALDQRVEAAGAGRIGIAEQQRVALDPKRVGHQQFGIEPGRVAHPRKPCAAAARASRTFTSPP